MRNIHVQNFCSLQYLTQKYGLSLNSLVNISIGNDDNIYMLFNENISERINGMFVDTQLNSNYHVLVLNVDWRDEMILKEEIFSLGKLKANYHFVQPLGTAFLLLGSRTHYAEPEPEKNALVISKDGTALYEMCLGDGIQDCIVTKKDEILTSYFDEGIFGNYGWDNPIGACGVILWNSHGESIWKADYPIYDCYAINIDEAENIWFYYYDEFSLVKTDLEKDIVFQPEIHGASAFLLTKDTHTILLDGGYNKHSQFMSARIEQDRLTDYQRTDIIYHNKPLALKQYIFRSSKAIFIDAGSCMYLKDVIQI